MAAPHSSLIRNTGIIAHIDAGKTTLSERILYYCDKIHRMGEVHDGAATMDYLPEEQERGITIAAACTSCNWNGSRINLVDTPGHMDFTMEVERCLRVLDSVIAVFCAVGGVEPQSETVWRQANEFSLARLAFINKVDRQGASFERVLDEMRQKLGAKPVPLTIPCGEGDKFSGIIDILRQKKLIFSEDDQGKTFFEQELSESEEELAQKWLKYVQEKTAEEDDNFLELWLEGDNDHSELENAIARATRKHKLVPVFCGSALRNAGVQPLLDGIVKYLPAPEENAPLCLINKKGQTERLDTTMGTLALVFKVDMTGGRKICYMRIYSGAIRENDTLLNMRTGKTERISRLYHVHADRRDQIPDASSGDIILVSGLKDARAGDTLTGGNQNCLIEPVQVLPQVITYSLEPRNSEEAKILDEALTRYAQEDPALDWHMDEESGLRMISGMGELHIEVTLERLGREYKISPRTGQPQVAMRETVLASASRQAVFDREFGKEHQYGEVQVKVESLPRGSGTELIFNVPEDEKQESEKNRQLWRKAIEDGINSVLQSGPLAGWPVTDLRVTILSLNKLNYTLPGLEMAAGVALREAIMEATPVLLEPIMQLEINVPEEFLGATVQLLQQNGGRVENINDKDGSKQLLGSAPMRRLFGFATRLRSSTQGRAAFSLSFRNHDQP